MRNLCTVQTVKELFPIEGRDKIKLATFINTGWKVIVDDAIHVGDKVVYCEYGTLLPVGRAEFEFLRKRCYTPKYNAFRIKAMKIASVVSEGIVFPLNIFSGEIDPTILDGEDVTEVLGAKKYDPELLEEQEVARKSKSWFFNLLVRIPFIKNLVYPKTLKGSWPSFFPGKTDETRAQVLPYIFDAFKGKSIYITEKMDGTSYSAAYYKRKMIVCSRNQWYKTKTTNHYWTVTEKFDIQQKLRHWEKVSGDTVVIQGEICGPSIQKNKYEFKDYNLFIFNIYSIQDKRYYSWPEMVGFSFQTGLSLVPILYKGPFCFDDIDQLVEYSKDNSRESFTPREGVVIRSFEPSAPMAKMANMMSFKVINPEFIAKWGL